MKHICHDYEMFLDDVLNSFAEQSATVEYNELLIANSFANEVRAGRQTYENVDLRNPERYNKFIKFVIGRNSKNYLMDSFVSESYKNVIMLTAGVLNSIFGDDSKIIDEFGEFLSYIDFTNSREVLDGYCYQLTDTRDGGKYYQVTIPTLENISAIVCLIHEFIHFHLQKNNIEPRKFYYGEILSILFEKIAADYIQNIRLDLQMVHKMENVRIDTIKYHYTEKKDDIREMKELTQNVDPRYFEFSKRLYTEHKAYYTLLAQSYGIGYLYAESLFCLYQENPQQFKQTLREVLYGEKFLQEVLDYHNINADNKDVYETAKKKIRLMTKI